MAPFRIGNYRIEKTLGVGSFGKVKRAEHEHTVRIPYRAPAVLPYSCPAPASPLRVLSLWDGLG